MIKPAQPATFLNWTLKAKPWGDGSSHPQEANIVCDDIEAVIAQDVEIATARELCERWNAYLRLLQEREKLRTELRYALALLDRRGFTLLSEIKGTEDE
jgi:hypothetical protein